ncbi:MAG: hypothetical protein RMI35_10660 [Leptospiraceae bacterium]|nr:hypothetical protein [Leptospiraceae bacterium]
MVIILRKFSLNIKKVILIILFLFFNVGITSQELADKDELDLYRELLRSSGELLYVPSKTEIERTMKSYIEEISAHKESLSQFYNSLKKLGYINEYDILDMELRSYKEHFFERKEMEVFVEYIRIVWKNQSPYEIILRNKSTLFPKLNIRNTVFVLPIHNFEFDNHQKLKDPSLEVLARLSYQAGMGEEFYFVFPSVFEGESSLIGNFQPKIYKIYDFTIGKANPKIINDMSLKIITYQYIIYRLRYLDVKFRSIIRNRLRKNVYEFYRSIPDTRY